ncbi:MAG: hypothetical protein SH857_14780 [Chitinophagales bacterium]|nr:hypothetical protein [Chitinophagales bacterium]
MYLVKVDEALVAARLRYAAAHLKASGFCEPKAHGHLPDRRHACRNGFIQISTTLQKVVVR